MNFLGRSLAAAMFTTLPSRALLSSSVVFQYLFIYSLLLTIFFEDYCAESKLSG
jgi:hypothetical protein